MEERKLVPIEVSAVLLVLCVCGVLLNIYQITIFYNNFVLILMNVVACLSYVLATLYCLRGYNKQNAKLFKYTCISYVVYALLYIASLTTIFSTNPSYIILLVLSILILLCRIVVTFKKNLGKKLSIIFVTVLILCSFATMIIFLRTYLLIGLDCIGRLWLDCILAIMIYGKYKDKELRGSK